MQITRREFIRVAKQVDTPTFDPSSCWIWTGHVNNKGYGLLKWRQQNFYVHRWFYRIFKGDIEKGLELDHLCHTPLCVNFSHLEPVTHLENVRRGNGGKIWREKTHCPQGHPYTQANTYISFRIRDRGRPERSCRTCQLRRCKARFDRKKLTSPEELAG